MTSLYLDDACDSALFERISGAPNRWKVRIRVYDGCDNFIVLERKLKSDRGVRKDRVRIDCRLYDALRAGDPEPLRRAARERTDCGRRRGERVTSRGLSLLEDVAREMTVSLLRPKVIVDYVREPYAHPLGNVRVCFDKRLNGSLTNLDLFRSTPYIPALVDGLIILEVKYDAFLPRSVQDLLQTDSLTRQSLSKYTLCRRIMPIHAWEDQ